MSNFIQRLWYILLNIQPCHICKSFMLRNKYFIAQVKVPMAHALTACPLVAQKSARTVAFKYLKIKKYFFSFKWFLIKAISIFLVLLIFALFIYSAPGLIMQRLLGG